MPLVLAVLKDFVIILKNYLLGEITVHILCILSFDCISDVFAIVDWTRNVYLFCLFIFLIL